MYLKTLFPQLKKISLADLFTIGFLAAVIYLLFYVGRTWGKAEVPLMQIDLDMAHLPLYASFSFARAMIALFLSLIFSMIYGTIAASSAKAEKWMIPILDILQSIPVLGFLPGLAIVMMALFPESRVGLEIVAILMIFTSQVWNMTFSIYQSVKQTPPVLGEVTRIYHLKFLRKFFWVELPYGMLALVWNAMMSVAGG
ncbi:MAG: ABC transporter permease, partial [bacterium]|nr:ABC transporter permease [bacterium]